MPRNLDHFISNVITIEKDPFYFLKTLMDTLIESYIEKMYILRISIK